MWKLVSDKDALVQELRAWVGSQSPDGNDHSPIEQMVSSIATDVAEGKNLDGWNRLDLVSEAEGRLDSQWYNRWVGRAGLLIPVAWGWSSIWSAAEAYGKLRNDQLQSNSFLWWWIEGMDGRLLVIHRLPSAALITVALIIVIGAAGVVAGQRSGRRLKHLWPLLVQAQVYIGQQVTMTPDELKNAVSKTLRELVDATNEIKTLMGTLGSLGTALDNERKKLSEYVSAQTTLVGGNLANASNNVASAGQSLSGSLSDLKKVVSSQSDIVKTLTNALGPFKNVSDAAQSMAGETDKLVTSLKGLSEHFQAGLDEPIGNILSASDLLAEVITQTTEHLTPLVDQSPDSPLRSMVEATDRLREVVKQLSDTLRRQQL